LILYLSQSEPAMRWIEMDFPWRAYVENLNKSIPLNVRRPFWDETFKVDGRPVPEDFYIRGCEWSIYYYPEGYFESYDVPIDERGVESSSMAVSRLHRILNMACQLAAKNDWIRYNEETMKFTMHPNLEK
ncbi:hypothetical protein EX30DRAFT_294798, partial [Ascodesmis nigricans]